MPTKMNRMKRLGSRLAKARNSAHYSQASAAKALKVHQVTLANWELGRHKPDVFKLIDMAVLYGMSLDMLILSIGTLSLDVAEQFDLSACRPWSDGSGRKLYSAYMRVLRRRLEESSSFGGLPPETGPMPL